MRWSFKSLSSCLVLPPTVFREWNQTAPITRPRYERAGDALVARVGSHRVGSLETRPARRVRSNRASGKKTHQSASDKKVSRGRSDRRATRRSRDRAGDSAEGRASRLLRRQIAECAWEMSRFPSGTQRSCGYRIDLITKSFASAQDIFVLLTLQKRFFVAFWNYDRLFLTYTRSPDLRRPPHKQMTSWISKVPPPTEHSRMLIPERWTRPSRLSAS